MPYHVDMPYHQIAGNVAFSTELTERAMPHSHLTDKVRMSCDYEHGCHKLPLWERTAPRGDVR